MALIIANHSIKNLKIFENFWKILTRENKESLK